MRRKPQMLKSEIESERNLIETKEIIANCPSFGKSVCQYTKEGIVEECWECREAYKIVPI